MVGWRTFFRLLGGNVATLASEKAPTYNDSQQIDSHDHRSARMPSQFPQASEIKRHAEDSANHRLDLGKPS